MVPPSSKLADAAAAKKPAILSLRDTAEDKKAREKRSQVSKKKKKPIPAPASNNSKAKQKALGEVGLKQILNVSKKSKASELANRESSSSDEEANPSKKRKTKPKVSLILAFDLGTTFSNFSWSLTNRKPENIMVNKSWPDSVGLHEKVPTIFARKEDNQELTKDAFGYKVSYYMISFSLFKLLVTVNGQPGRFEDPLLRETVGLNMLRLPEGMDHWGVIAYFYGLLVKHARHVLDHTFSKDFMDNTPIKACITVPANWDDGDRADAKRAAEAVDIGTRDGDTLTVLSEPEAAATISIYESIRDEKDASPFKIGTSTIVVDVGGGTCDLKSFIITRPKPLRLTEACVGKGDTCGATSIYRAFKAWAGKTFGEAFTNLPEGPLASSSQCYEKFEQHMRSFKPEDAIRDYKVPLLPLMSALRDRDLTPKNYDFSEASIRFDREIMKGFFSLVVEMIYRLVDQQLGALVEEHAPPPSTLILCGGLAGCPYIVDQLDKFCADRFHGEVVIKVPRQPWSSVARGAVYHLLQPHLIEARKSRWAYGVEVAQAWQQGVDKESDLYICPIRGRRARGYVSWLFHKGQSIGPSTKAKLPTSFGMTAMDDFKHIEVALYKCDAREPPPLARVDEEGVMKVGTVSLDYWREDNKFKSKDVEITVFGGLAADSGLLKFWMQNRGEILGYGTVEYDTMAGTSMKHEAMPDDEPPEISEANPTSHSLSARKRRKEVELIESFIQGLDFTTFAELSIIYYSDCLTGVFLFRSLLQVVALSPRPPGVPELDPAKAHLSLILTSTVLSIFIHLARDSPQAGEVSRGYLLGGLLVDFIGELGPIPKFKLILLDVLVGLLQVVSFTTNIKKAKIKDPSASTSRAATTQDHDAEEAGLRRSVEGRENAEDGPPQEGAELQSLLSQEESAYMPVANMDIHPLDDMYTGDFVLLKLDLWNDIKNYLVLESASSSLPSVDSARATRLVRSLIFGRPGA